MKETEYDNLPLDVLRNRKIGLEIEQLKKNWYLKPGYMAILVPGVIALVSLIVALYSGVFDVKKEKLELEQLKLEKEVVYFQEEKSRLKTAIDSFEKHLSEKEEFISEIKNNYNNQLKSLQNGNEKLISDLEKNKLDYGKTKLLYEDRIKVLEKNIEKLFKKEKSYELSIKQKNDSITKLNTLVYALDLEGLRKKYYKIIDFNSKELNVSIQKKLRNLGFFNGQVDGIIGPRTKKAIREFKKIHQLGNDDLLNESTIVEIFMANYLKGA